MTGINQNIAFAVQQIRTTFCRADGSSKSGTGTGFWIHHPPSLTAFVTNKHNVDPVTLWGPSTQFTLAKIEIGLRASLGTEYTDQTFFGEITDHTAVLRVSPNADCAVLINPIFKDIASNSARRRTVPVAEIADAGFHKKVQMMDFASFIGFPGNDGQGWWDTSWTLPIARMATIASVPHIPFTNPAIKTADVTLVSGFSFSGSSGSPIISHSKGVRLDNVTLTGSDYFAPRVLGIMSGHRNQQDPVDGMFRHTGLSYYTRSTSILALL